MPTPRLHPLALAAAIIGGIAIKCLAGVPIGPQIVAKVGDLVPGIIGATFTSFDAPVINNAGTVAFKAAFTGGGATSANNDAIFAGPPNAPVLWLRKGDVFAPVLAETYGFLDPRVVLADDGNLFVAAQLTGPAVTPSNDRILVVNSGPGEDTVLLREGDPLGGTLSVAPAGLTFQATSGVFLANRDGHAAVVAGVTDSTAPGTAKFGVLHINALDGNDVIAVSGEPAPNGLGTFTPEFPGGNPFEALGVGPLGGVTFRGDGATGSDRFRSFLHYDPVTNTVSLVAVSGDATSGTKPGSVLALLGDPAATGGGLVIFDSILGKTPGDPDFSEIGLFTSPPREPGSRVKIRPLAVRDRKAPKTGGVFAGFPTAVVNQNGTALFLSDLFKRPDGFPQGQGTGVFGGPRKPQLIAQSGRPVPGLPGTTVVNFNFGGLTITNANQAFILCTAEPDLETVLVCNFGDKGPPTTEIFVQSGLSVSTGTGSDTVTTFDFPFGGTTSSDGKPRSVNDVGAAVMEVVFVENGNVIYSTGTSKAPPEGLQPDIILNETTKVGDDVHQMKAESPQTPEREQPVNTEVDYVFFIQNDGTARDVIEFTSSGSNARDRFKWIEGEANGPDISDDVFGEGRTFTLDPGDKVRVRLRANRQTLENKPKTDKIKMKAVSTNDKQKRDAFQLTVKFTAVP